VVRPFVEGYRAGETPIPCTLCNNFIKFDRLLTTAQQIGAERLATGHYARVRHNPSSGRFELRRAVDSAKDQSYFLFGLTQKQLARTEFPLGELMKQEVRALAREKGLPVADKPESQEICFVPSGHYAQFLEAYQEEQGMGRGARQGEIVTADGRIIGEHAGLHRFTIGQRRGLGVATGKPLYVIALEQETNRVIVGEESELYRDQAHAHEVNWVSLSPPQQALRCRVKIRHKHEPAAATLIPQGENGPSGGVRILFDEPQRAVTPGQAAVFYGLGREGVDRELVLGGGWLH
jgi:tRNA-specific 2-thiouridylase